MIGTKKGYCADCDNYDRLVKVGESDSWVCEECYPAYHKCHHCEEMVHEDYLQEDAHKNRICDRCAEETHGRCANCEGLYHRDDLKEDDHYNTYCEGCIDDGCGEWRQHYLDEEADRKYDAWRNGDYD